MSIVALVGVLGSGPVSVLLGAAISIVLLLRQASRPRVVELARVPGTTVFADRSRHPETRVQPGLLIVRCESALLYFNVEFIRERVFEILQARAEPIRFVVFALRTVPKVDLAGAELLADLHRSLRARAVAFCVADSRGEVRGALRRIGFEREHGPLETGQTVEVVVTAWLEGAEQHLRDTGASPVPRSTGPV